MQYSIEDYNNIKDFFNYVHHPIFPYRLSIYNIEHMEEYSTKSFVRNILNENMESQYKSLYGVSGQKYFRLFKKYIINEEVEERDLLFKVEGETTKWII